MQAARSTSCCWKDCCWHSLCLLAWPHCCESDKDSCQVSSAAVPLQVKEHITRLAKKGATPSSIGVTLRDSHGIAQVGYTAC